MLTLEAVHQPTGVHGVWTLRAGKWCVRLTTGYFGSPAIPPGMDSEGPSGLCTSESDIRACGWEILKRVGDCPRRRRGA